MFFLASSNLEHTFKSHFELDFSALWTPWVGFPGASVVENSPANARDTGLIPRSRRSPGEGNGNPLQYSCLENPIDRGAWRATVHRVTKELDVTLQTNNNKSHESWQYPRAIIGGETSRPQLIKYTEWNICRTLGRWGEWLLPAIRTEK